MDFIGKRQRWSHVGEAPDYHLDPGGFGLLNTEAYTQTHSPKEQHQQTEGRHAFKKGRKLQGEKKGCEKALEVQVQSKNRAGLVQKQVQQQIWWSKCLRDIDPWPSKDQSKANVAPEGFLVVPISKGFFFFFCLSAFGPEGAGDFFEFLWA